MYSHDMHTVHPAVTLTHILQFLCVLFCYDMSIYVFLFQVSLNFHLCSSMDHFEMLKFYLLYIFCPYV